MAEFVVACEDELPPKFRLPRVTWNDVTLGKHETKMAKLACPTEFKELAVKRIKAG
ncbi:MAG: hypothetical protein JNK99_16645 [Candidatus Accumulibacter sp.]|uniref:hypothetical protein n=1 Tax=Accumulibacter sp. TaxID=2053492 RepID=UPI001A42E9A7|nr:hypothetical protein [Accumulibacter sp.]MBL8396346.1 hypothetical protein [Accumulibacter sp.]